MATPVKTIVMAAIGDALEGITEIVQVIEGQSVPTDDETRKGYPWACYFDETETKEARNRIAKKAFDLIVQVWVSEDAALTLNEQLDLLDAEVEKALLNDSGVWAAVTNVEPTTTEKFYIDDGRAILQAVYRVVYLHAWKDPYNPAKG